MVISMTRIETHLPIPSIQLEDITIDLSDIVTREQAGEYDEPAKKPKKEKVQAKSAKQENNEDSELDIASLVSTPVPEFELIENKVLESEIRAMYTETPDLLILSKQTVHTPFALCWEILENMGIDANKKFLVVSALEFVVVLLDVFKVPKENIFFLDEGQKDGTIDSIKAVVLEKFGFEQHQILSIGGVSKMKFDYVVGNPPWGQNTNNGSTNGTKLYESIVSIAVNVTKENGIISMIIPSKFIITKNSKFAKMVHDVGIVEIHDFGNTRFDNVDKGCVNLVMQKGINRNGTFRVVSKTGERSRKADVFMCISDGDVTNVGPNFGELWIRGKKKRSELIRTENGTTVIETVNGQDGPLLTATIATGSEDTGIGSWKVVINNFNNHDSIGPIKVAPPDYAICFSVVAFPCESEEQAKKFMEYLKSTEIAEMYKRIPKSTANSKTVFSMIPLPQ